MAATKVTIAGINRVVVTNTYDSVGNLLTSTDALSHTRTMAGYDIFRHPATVTDPAGVTTTLTYDTHGNLKTQSTPIGNGQNRAMTFGYDPAHPADLATILDPNGRTWTYGHDAYGFTTSVIDPAGDKTTMVFDTVGRPASSVSPRGNKPNGTPTAFTTNYTTDAYGQVLTATDPLGHVQTWHYDANRNLDWSKDANLHQTNYGYNDANERITTQRPDGSTLTTSFRADGLISAQIDAAGRSTGYVYDALGRTASVTDPDNCKTAYTYDSAGNLATKTDPNPGSTCNGTATGGTTTYGYDAASQPTTITYSDGTTPNVTFTYDPAGRRQTMVDGTGTTTYTWDNLSQLLTSTDGGGNTVRYDWDPAGNNIKIAYPGGSCTTPVSLCVTQAFDLAGRMTSTTDWLGNTTQFTPDENSNIASITYPAGSGNTDTYTFDNADRLMGITDKKGTTTLATQTLTRANTGLLGSVNQTGLAGSGARYFGYTNNDRLCYVAGAAGTNPTCAAPPSGAQKYTYDNADNVTQQLDGTIQAMDPANRLCYTAPAGTTPTACATPPTGATTFASDNRGNRTAKTPPGGAATGYTYDQANRLTSATVPSQSGATGQYTSVTPARIVNSTNGTGIPTGQVAPGATATIQVTGQGGIPATGATAVALELTTANQTSASCLTAYPSDQAAPTAANLCYTTNKPISNLAIVKPGADGKIKILNAGFGATDLFVDTQGWYGAGTGSGSFNAVTPARIADTRPASNIGVPAGQIPANGTLLVPITGQGGVPTTGVASVTANVSVLNATGTGFVVAYPADAATPNTRTVSYNSGQPMSGLDNVKIATGTNAGKIKLTNTSTTPIDVVVDVQGWTATTATPTGAGYQPVVPARVYDSRTVGAGTAFAAGETRSIQVAGQVGVPATGATAVAVTITALGQSGVGYLTAYQTGTTLPATANLVYPSNQAASNLAIVSLSASGKINLTNLGFSTTQAIVDISGYYTTDTATWTYAYSGSGLRQSKTGPPARAGLTGATRFVWGPGSTPNVLVETNTAAAGNQPDVTRYVYGPDGLPTTQITSINGGAQTVTYLHHDQQGSTVLATNTSGANVGTWAYDPYGNITATTGTATTRLGYNGEYRDPETGFIYLRNRFYDPTTGQFLTRDPLNAMTRSAYGYVGGNPLNRADPSGLWDFCVTGVSGHNPDGSEICNGAGEVSTNAWRPARAAMAMSNPLTMVVTGYGFYRGTRGTGSCGWNSENWVNLCTNVPQDSSHTFGLVVTTNLSCDQFAKDNGGGTAAHETKHVDQYATGGLPLFVADVFAMVVRSGLDGSKAPSACYSVTEQMAGWKDGGYDECR